MQDPAAAKFVEAVANGDDILGGTFEAEPDFAIHLGLCATEADARQAGAAFERVLKEVKPVVEAKAKKASTGHYAAWLRTWWRPLWHRREFLDSVASLGRVVACSRVALRPVFFFLKVRGVVALERIQLFGFADDYSFGVIQSSQHWQWARVQGGRQEERIVYSTEVWRTLPWPQEPTEQEVAGVAAAGRELRRVRDALMRENSWSLRALYQAAEVAGPHPLKDAQAALDEAVRKAYAMPSGVEATEFLLELNKLVAEDEAEGRTVQGPGLPCGLDPRDPRWTSDDCIEPPKI